MLEFLNENVEIIKIIGQYIFAMAIIWLCTYMTIALIAVIKEQKRGAKNKKIKKEINKNENYNQKSEE